MQFDIGSGYLIGVCQDNKIRIHDDKGKHLAYEHDTSPHIFTTMLICWHYKVILFGNPSFILYIRLTIVQGTSQGSIRVHLWPLTDFKRNFSEFVEFPVHQSAITSMAFTADMRYLITAAEDGSIFFNKVKELDEGVSSLLMEGLRTESEQAFLDRTYQLNRICLTSKVKDDIKVDQIKELQFKIQNIKSDTDDQIEKIIGKYFSDQKTAEEKNKDKLKRQKEQLIIMIDEEDQRILDYKDKMELIKKEHVVNQE